MKKYTFILSIIMVLLFVSCDFSTHMDMKEVGITMMQKKEVKSVIVKMVNSVDVKQWGRATEQFAETVFVDYSSMNGQPGADVKSSDLVGGWEKLLTENINTQHMLTNFEIEISENKAKVQCHIYASHTHETIPYWDIFGRYLYELEKTESGWKITSMTLIVHGQKGNANFMVDAQK